MQDMISLIRRKKPLVHHITNYVTVNDCANVTLAIGAAPVMADAWEEVEEMVSIASSLVINIGTLNSTKIKSMIVAGKKANQLGIPVVFDPVGCGATSYRMEMANLLMKEIHMTVIRGNLSEIMALAGESIHMKGVDAERTNTTENMILLKKCATRWKNVLAVTGEIDKITDGNRLVEIANGTEKMAAVTGTGCMCTSLIGAFVGTCPNAIFDGTVEAVMVMGVAGEVAWEQNKMQGLGHFHAGIVDEIGKMDTPTLERWGNFHGL